MKKTYTLLLLFTTCSVYVCNGDIDIKNKCDSDKCYRNVNTTHENLLQLLNQLNSTSLSSKITKPYSAKPFQELIEEVEELGHESRKTSKRAVSQLNSIIGINNTLNQILENITKNENDMFQKLDNITQINKETSAQLNQILEKVQEKHDTVKKLFDLHQNVSKTCDLAENTYTKLQEEVNGIFTLYKKDRKNYEKLKNKTKTINESLSETVEGAIKNKEGFEQIKLPYSVAEGFLNQTVENLNLTISLLKINSDILENLLKASYNLLSDQLKNQSDTVWKTLSDIQRDVNSMNEELENFDKEIIKDNFPALTINDDSIRLIDLIEKELINAEEKYKEIDLTDEEKNLLSEEHGVISEIQKETEKLANYTMLLNLIPASEKKLQKIEAEINNFRISIYLMEQSKEAEEKLAHLRKLRDEAVKLPCNPSTNILT